MHERHSLSLKISTSIVLWALIGILFWFYWYFESSSIKDFVSNLMALKSQSGAFHIIWFFILFSSALFILSYGLHYFYSRNIFIEIQEYNKKLRDYNHFLAHELKTPISGIYSDLEILTYQYDEKRVLSSQKQLKNMIKIIDSLLNFSESLKLTNKTDINLENFLKKQLFFYPESKDIRIHNTLFNFSISTDELLFTRVIKNIIENAIKYSTDGEMDIYIKKEKIIFQNNISQTLNSKQLEQVLEVFYSKSFEQKKGHGIGIPMLQEICKILGYTLSISSKDKLFIVEIIYEKINIDN